MSEHLFTAQETTVLDEWVSTIEESTKKYPILSETDLIIEGGVGGGITMVHIARRLFPHALYIGTDLDPSLNVGKKRLEGTIDHQTLQRVLATNESPAKEMYGAVVRASCFNDMLIRDIMRKTGRNNPVLVSYNALYAITNGIVPSADKLSYIGHLHITNRRLWDDEEQKTYFFRSFYDMESHAQRLGWITERVAHVGLLVVREDGDGRA